MAFMEINQQPEFQKTALSLDTGNCRLPHRQQMPSPADTLGSTHSVSLQAPASKACSSTHERNGPQLCACPHHNHNEVEDGAQLKQLMPDVSVFVMVRVVNIQEGGDSTKSPIWPTECEGVFPQHALALDL